MKRLSLETQVTCFWMVEWYRRDPSAQSLIRQLLGCGPKGVIDIFKSLFLW